MFEIGIIGDQRCRLQIADLIGLLDRRHDRHRCVKGWHAFRVKPASVEFRAASSQRLTGVDRV
jgi:hypothetical protein